MAETTAQILQRVESRIKAEEDERNARYERIIREAQDLHRKTYSGWCWSTNGHGVKGCLLYDRVDTLVHHPDGKKVGVDDWLWMNMDTADKIAFCAGLTREMYPGTELKTRGVLHAESEILGVLHAETSAIAV